MTAGMEVSYAPIFLRTLRALPSALQEEAIEKIERFKDSKHHESLKVHKLRGRLSDCFGFSVNYAIRIVFEYSDTKPKRARLLAIGDHSVYDT